MTALGATRDRPPEAVLSVIPVGGVMHHSLRPLEEPS